MKWKNNGYGQLTAKCGHLFLRIETIDQYKEPGHKDFEPRSFEFFIEPDDEDKSYRRALSTGRGATKAEVFHAMIAELRRLADVMVADINSPGYFEDE